MPISSTKRAWIAVAILILAIAAGAGAYLYRMNRPLAGPSAGPPPDIMSLLPPGAPVVAYIDVAELRKLQGSALAEMLGLAGTDSKQDADYQNFVRQTGFDYARDLDKVALAVWPTSLLTPNVGLGQNQVMAFADGRFDQERIKAYALRTGKIVTGGKEPFYSVPGNPPSSFRFLSATRIELTDTPDMNFPTPAPNEVENAAMRARVHRVASAPIFAAARTDTLPKSFYDSFKNSPQLEALARSIQGMTFAGQPQDNRIDLALDAESDSLAHAAEIATLLDTFRVFGTMALSDPKTRQHMTREQGAFLMALASQLKVTHQDRWVRLTLGVTPEMMGSPNSSHAELQ
jgi:hypothetical protein